MKTGLRAAVLSAALLIGVLASGTAHSAPIVSTGPVEVGASTPNWVLNYSQWLGSRFSVAGPTTITDVSGFFGCNSGGGLLAVLHADGGTIPGQELYSRAFSVTAGEGVASYAESERYTYHYGWFGAGGLDWTIGPGSYWLTFETPAVGPGYDGVMPGGAQNPLASDAHTNWGPWYPSPEYEHLRLGMRIDGATGVAAGAAPVPEPASMLLLGTGLAGLAAARRARKKASSL